MTLEIKHDNKQLEEIDQDENSDIEVQKSFTRKITVEPIALLYVLAKAINAVTSKSLMMDKACRVNLGFSDEICNAIKSNNLNSTQSHYLEDTEMVLGFGMSWKIYMSTSVPMIFVLLAGSFSDKTGIKKFFIIIPIIGQLLIGIHGILSASAYNLPMAIVVFPEALMEGLTGGWCLCYMGIFSYICTITSNSNRTLRIGLITAIILISNSVGMGAATMMVKPIGFYGCYAIIMFLQLINLMYALFLLKEPQTQEKLKGISCLRGLCMYFNIKNVRDTARVIYRTTPDNRNKIMFLLFALIAVLYTPLYGDTTVIHKFTNTSFDWDDMMANLFLAYTHLVNSIGVIFLVLVFSKYLQWHDSIIGSVACLSWITGSLMKAFAPNQTLFLVAPVAAIFTGGGILAVCVIFSKTVDRNELGKIAAIVSVMDNFMTIVSRVAYRSIYKRTESSSPGAVFLISAGLVIVSLWGFIHLFYVHQKQPKTNKPQYFGPDIKL